MAVVDKSLYEPRDINAYFTGIACMYDGEVAIVGDSSDNRVHISSRGWVEFTDEKLTFPQPHTGCIQMGDRVVILNKEPHRQWKKGFRLRDSSTQETVTELPQYTSEMERITYALTDTDYDYATAYRKVFDGDALSHKINRSFYLKVGFNGRFIEVYHRSSVEIPIALAQEGNIQLYVGAELFREQLEKLGVLVNENNP